MPWKATQLKKLLRFWAHFSMFEPDFLGPEQHRGDHRGAEICQDGSHLGVLVDSREAFHYLVALERLL